jgi:tetratricopeptide (TPR) repeat protein
MLLVGKALLTSQTERVGMSSNNNHLNIKKPDAFQVFVAGLLDEILKRKVLLTRIAYGVVAVGVVIYGVVYFLNYREQNRRENLAKIDAVWTKEEEAVNGEREKLEKELTELEKKMGAAETAQPEKEKLEVQLKEYEAKMAAIEPKHDDSAAQYKSYFEKNKDNAEGWNAGLRFAGYKLSQKDPKSAIEVLSVLNEKVKNHVVFELLTKMMLVGALQDIKDYDRALKVNEQALASAPKSLKPRLLLTKGNIQMQLNQKDAAKATFDQIVKDFDSSQEAASARGLKAVLN